MPPRPALPADDLYARLEVPSDATPEAIEIAWRALLRRHHPDVAGPTGLERAKRINVAHDWLSDPGLRARYDHERGLRRSAGAAARGRPARPEVGRPAVTERAHPAVPTAPSRGPAGELPRTGVEPHGGRARSAGPRRPDTDRLRRDDPAVPARRPACGARLGGGRGRAVDCHAEAAALPGIRDASLRMPPSWSWGPISTSCSASRSAARTRERLSAAGKRPSVSRAMARTVPAVAGPDRPACRRSIGRGVAELWAPAAPSSDSATMPWPAGTSPDDDDGLRVSAALAARDAAAAVQADGMDRRALARARRAAARIAHLLVLRHAFAAGDLRRARRAVAATTRAGRGPAPRVRRPGR